jgi:dephospho-CoA kinase
MKLVGISGTNGSGKDSLGQILAEDYGWLFISVTEILRDELRARSQEVTRENLRSLSSEWRRSYGHGVLIDKALKIYEPQQGDYEGLVISSLRNPGEAEELHRLGGQVVWTDANPKIRYERIQKNAANRSRAGEDNKTFEQFQKEEYDEMHHHGGDDTTLNMAGVKAMADIFIENNTNNIEDFKKTIKKALNP